ncbi:hypothetical protein ACIBH1_03825 [Nonomuraea sp. NPDC050663]|uniref:hypothetical protein n=1 Tax=Nonomuraea sp. NPDC050663 TaxID=3364370 RepID=UPI0037A85FF5
MARRVARPDVLSGKVLVLDAQALSLWADDDERMRARIKVATAHDYIPVISSVTLVEQRRGGKAGQRLAWLRSRLTIIGAGEEVADLAARLLSDAGLDGHDNVVDALVVATAATAGGPARVASSDGSHIPKLCQAASALRAAPVEWLRV